MEGHCIDADDKFLPRLRELAAWAERLDTAPDDAARLEVLVAAEELRNSYGQKANWPGCDLQQIKDDLATIRQDARRVREQVIDRVLRRLARRIAEATLDAARVRQGEGLLEFHDLLVLARELLRAPGHGPHVRARLQERYQRLLVDEFQDTDPIQIELAVRIAGGADAEADDWRDVVVPDGSLFIVGDPKQSIYRFRRADITTYLDAQDRIGRRLALTTNFRSTPHLLDSVNAVFGRLITAEPGSQPAFQPLDHHRPEATGGARVLTIGPDPHPVGTTADQVREMEAAEVATVVRTAMAEQWPVWDDARATWRPVELTDIAVLVPARTSLPQLEEALDGAGIPFRAEASSLVYRTPEVRDLLMTARAVDDPSDALALVSALRSPVFGCGDDDLWTWKRDGGTFNLLAPLPDDVPDGHPVRDAVTYLRALHRERTWRAPSEVLDRIVRDRRMLEVGGLGTRSRDVWRRLRFVIDQSRAWSEAERGGLRSYLAWARRQGDESSRVAEAILPETDMAALRVMTIHAAKGLEFPVVIMSGLSSRPGGGRGGVEVLWPREGGYEVKLGKSLQTGDFDVVKPVDEQMDHHERLRLLYVACTRARDHLVVSLHRAARKQPPSNGRALTSAELMAEAAQAVPATPTLRPLVYPDVDLVVESLADGVVEPFEQWARKVEISRWAAARPSAISASSLEGSAQTAVADGTDQAAPDPGLAKDARDLELPPWNKGRYGTAVGRAVHGALQTVDLSTDAGLAEVVAAQALAEGVLEYQDVVEALCRSAISSDVVQRAAARRHWRETYVGSTRDDGTVLEGYVDLLYREDDGSLVILDYKTDAVPAAALESRVAFYTPQMSAYAEALTRALGEPVDSAVLLFLQPTAAVAATVHTVRRGSRSVPAQQAP
jgi:ATP-dependent exoDNAse (exonuclease V) beta subunit